MNAPLKGPSSLLNKERQMKNPMAGMSVKEQMKEMRRQFMLSQDAEARKKEEERKAEEERKKKELEAKMKLKKFRGPTVLVIDEVLEDAGSDEEDDEDENEVIEEKPWDEEDFEDEEEEDEIEI